MNIRLKNEKKWTVRPYNTESAEKVARETEIPLFLARILCARGIDTPEKAADFLSGDALSFHDPFLLADMEKACARIKSAVENGERILIYGDYDVDGISSVAALYLYLSSKEAQVCYYIPERLSEGYGLNTAAIDRFAAAKIRLVITVDTGITAVEEAAYAKQKGIDLIITDHHECRGALPTDALAVINPKRPDNVYPFTELAGVGVVFKLLCALEGEQNLPALCEKYLDIVSLGTVADVMPLHGENRTIVSHGLSVLNNRKGANLGVRALLYAAQGGNAETKKNITATTVGFIIAPRLNAAGRIGEVKHAAELLITRDPDRALAVAEELCALNRERQAIEAQILAEALEQIDKTVDFEKDRVLVLSSDHWHQGVIGIVASRLVERCNLPCILITTHNGVGKGSARSIKGFNINEAIGACRELLLKCGGHELAAGLSLEEEKIGAFREAINAYAAERITEEMRLPELAIDLELSENELDTRHAEMLGVLEPYGNGNPSPVFALRDAVIESVTPIGNDKHLRLLLSRGECSFTALYFNKTPAEFTFEKGAHVDAAFSLEINEFRGARSVQLHLRDLRPSSETLTYINRQAKEYLRAIATFTVSAENLPDITVFRKTFVYLRNALQTSPHIDICSFSQKLRAGGVPSTPCMVNIMLDVFAERGLITLSRDGLNDAEVSLCAVEGKVNLEESTLLSRLRQNAGK